MLNNEALNKIDSKEIFDDLNEKQRVFITTYFYHEGIVNKLQSVIEKKVNQVDGSGRLVIVEENLWAKEINKVKTKKGIFVFNDSELRTRRNQNEEYLLTNLSKHAGMLYSIIYGKNKELATPCGVSNHAPTVSAKA